MVHDVLFAKRCVSSMWHRTKARQSSMTCIYAVGCLISMEHVWERGLFDKLLDWGDTPSYFGVLGVFGIE